MPPSMVDVAKRAGVALSTVSYALNGTRPVSAETRERIDAAVAELGYRRNALARGLASRRSRNIAMLCPASERGLGATEMEFVAAAAEAASEQGYHLVLWSTEVEDKETVDRLTQQGLVDGVLLMEVRLDDMRVSLLEQTGMPFALIGRTADPDRHSFVDIDFAQTTHDAWAHLAALGHRRIAFLNHSERALDAGYGPSVRAVEGVARASEELGVSTVSVTCDDTPHAGHDTARALLAEDPDITAIVLMNERASAGVLAALGASGRSVPDDVSVMSIVSSVHVAEMSFPPLSTFSPPSAELGRLGVEVLVSRLESDASASVHELLPCRLVDRGSTAPAPAPTQRPASTRRS